ALDRLFIAADAYEACRDASVLVVLTEWDEFRWLDFDRVRRAMASPAVVDARNVLDPHALRRRGFHYQGVGR
ncbi:MAG TPA: UDP binding domain-containing protein, partial [Acidimicrobiia bacterium]|nr:UDP binding domain-containing protein [Acidimicrobiia bacterium]